MADALSKLQRSQLMGRVRGTNTRFELSLLKVLSAEVYPLGYRYRKHYRKIYGTPDVAFVSHKVAVFLDSDFWHGRNYDRLADRMTPFWRQKIERNMERDLEVNKRLRREGWSVLRFGEAEVKREPLTVVKRIRATLERRGAMALTSRRLKRQGN